MNKILDVLKLIFMTLLALCTGIITWWVLICILIIFVSLIALLSKITALIIFGICMLFILIIIFFQIFNPTY